MKRIPFFSQRQQYRPLPRRPLSPFQENVQSFKAQLSKWVDHLPSLTTRHATLLVTSTCLPAILASTDWTSPYPLPQLRRHAIMTFQTKTTTMGYPVPTMVSPLYTWMTCTLYHPNLTHLAMYGGSLMYHSWALDRGFWNTLMTWATGTVMYIGGTWMSLAFNTVSQKPLAGLQRLWKSHSVYGLHGVTLHFQFALLTKYARILYRLYRIQGQPKLSSQRRTLVEKAQRRYIMQFGLSALSLVPGFLTTDWKDHEAIGIMASAVSGCISSFYFERYLSM